MMDVVFFLIELLKICWGKTNKIDIFLWEFVKLDVDDACRVTIVLEAVVIDEVDDVMHVC